MELLRQLYDRYPKVKNRLIVTRGGELTMEEETDAALDELKSLASGSFRTEGMIVIPCSMKTWRASYPAIEMGLAKQKS